MLRILIATLLVATGCVTPFQPPSAWIGNKYDDVTAAIGPPTLYVSHEQSLKTDHRRMPMQVNAGHRAVWLRATYSWGNSPNGVHVDQLGGRRAVIGGMCLLEMIIERGRVVHVKDGCRTLHEAAR